MIFPVHDPPLVCGAEALFWPDEEACEAVCGLPLGHDGDHMSPSLGRWDEEELVTSMPERHVTTVEVYWPDHEWLRAVGLD